jgi:hypothetical protein
MSQLQKKPSALKRGHPTLQNMNFYKKYLLLWVIFVLLDPDPDSGSGSTDPIESGSGSATLDPSIHIIEERKKQREISLNSPTFCYPVWYRVPVLPATTRAIA